MTELFMNIYYLQHWAGSRNDIVNTLSTREAKNKSFRKKEHYGEKIWDNLSSILGLIMIASWNIF